MIIIYRTIETYVPINNKTYEGQIDKTNHHSYTNSNK
jgi:hypothetical protein